jgi:hypothetical protein
VYVSSRNDVHAQLLHPFADHLYESGRLCRILGSLPAVQCIVIKNAFGLRQHDYRYKVPRFIHSLPRNHRLGDWCRGEILPCGLDPDWESFAGGRKLSFWL